MTVRGHANHDLKPRENIVVACVPAWCRGSENAIMVIGGCYPE